MKENSEISLRVRFGTTLAKFVQNFTDKVSGRLLQVVFLILIAHSYSCQNHQSGNTLAIAAAANMQFALTEIAEKFEQEKGVKINLIISSSGKLTAQIKEGAPYDVFLAANQKYPNEIYKSGWAEAPPKIYARGKLILWSINKNIQPTFDILQTDKIQHIALANPKTAPYGAAALEFLQEQNLLEKVKNKLVFGESIAQTNQFITAGAAEIGFTAKSVVLSPKMKDKGNWIELPETSYTKIQQGVILIKNKKNNPSARAFFDFLFEKEAQEILVKYGYSL